MKAWDASEDLFVIRQVWYLGVLITHVSNSIWFHNVLRDCGMKLIRRWIQFLRGVEKDCCSRRFKEIYLSH